MSHRDSANGDRSNGSGRALVSVRCRAVGHQFIPESEEREQQMLARLADGSLDDADREAVEAYVASSREAQVRLARQRRVAMALRAGGPVLSPRAQAELDALTKRTPRRRLISPAPLVGLATVAAAIAAIVVLVGARSNPPSITQTAQLAYSPPTNAAPRPNPTQPRLLDASFGGIVLPNYEAEFGVPATGQRTDVLGGRKLLTVYYRLPNGNPMSYSIVSGGPLALPRGARLVTYRSVQIRGYTDRGLAIVTLVRNGRTCVLAGKTTVGELVSLAEAPLRTL
jgi:hypothetical protein